MLEPCLNSHLQQKGLYVARTPVNVKEDRVVPLRVFNVSHEVFYLAAETVIAFAKPVTDVTSLELNEENYDGAMGQDRVINEHVSQGAVDMTLPKDLRELLERSTDNLTDSETAGDAIQLQACVLNLRRGLWHHAHGPAQNRYGQCFSNPNSTPANFFMET